MSQRPLKERVPVAPPAAGGAHPREASAAFVARVHMRAANSEDVVTLVPLINNAYKPRDGWLFGEQLRLDDEALRDELADDRTASIVAEVDGDIAGFAVVRMRDRYAGFGLLAVGQGWQGNGLARLIVTHAEKLALGAGCVELRLECIRENNLPPFYEALGYRVHAEEFASRWNSSQPFTLVDMRKALR